MTWPFGFQIRATKLASFCGLLPFSGRKMPKTPIVQQKMRTQTHTQTISDFSMIANLDHQFLGIVVW